MEARGVYFEAYITFICSSIDCEYMFVIVGGYVILLVMWAVAMESSRISLVQISRSIDVYTNLCLIVKYADGTS